MTDTLTAENQINQLQELASQCDHFSVQQPSPSEVVIEFQGKFIAGVDSNSNQPTARFNEQQSISLTLDDQFPHSPPSINWQSEIYHPNISLTGNVSMQDIGLTWEPGMDLLILCERLWDIARLAYLEKIDPANSNAGNWFARSPQIEIPLVDTLFGCPASQPLRNVFKYRRKSNLPPVLQNSRAAARGDDDVFYIGD